MIFQFHPYAVVLVISALTTLTTSIIILRREVPGSAALGGVLLGTFVWSGAYAMIWSLVELADKVLWMKIMYFGVLAVPTLFLAFILKITHHDDWLTARNLVLLSVQPMAMIVAVWFDIRLIFDRIDNQWVGEFAVLHLERGFGFWINTYYSYAIILLAFFILGLGILRATPFFRRQYLIILVGSIIPFTASLFTQMNYNKLADLDMAPISFGVSSILYAYAVFRHQFMDLVPVARGHLIESMSDGVLVLDEHNRIVDINPAMQSIVDKDPNLLIGQNVSAVLNLWTQNAEQLLNGIETRTELKVPKKPSSYLICGSLHCMMITRKSMAA